MPSKKEQILSTALRMFGQEGYKATSTARIAKEAAVSEALIFKHFGSKQGLLDAILNQGFEALQASLKDILSEEDPKSLIKKSIDIPFSIPKSDYNFWRLQFALKWEINFDMSVNVKPLIDALEIAFRKLDYENPRLEAEHLFHFLDGTVMSTVRGTLKSAEEMRDFVHKKYGLG